MDDRDILDAPEGENQSLRIPLTVVLLTILGFTITYSVFFKIDLIAKLSQYRSKFGILNFNLSQLIFLALTSLGLYFFLSFIKSEISHWFRVMTISISILFVSLTFVYLFIISPNTGIHLFVSLKYIVYIALISGGGCSLAVQFLHKKHYLIFSAIMICTIVFLSLINYL